MKSDGWDGGNGPTGLQEPQTSGHRNLSQEKTWHDSEGTRHGRQHPLLGLGLGLPRAVVSDAAFPDCHSEPLHPHIDRAWETSKPALRGPLS